MALFRLFESQKWQPPSGDLGKALKKSESTPSVSFWGLFRGLFLACFGPNKITSHSTVLDLGRGRRTEMGVFWA